MHINNEDFSEYYKRFDRIKNKTFIYALFSSENNIIRYIGKANVPYNRYYSHIAEAKYTNIKTHKLDWIRSVIKKDFELNFKILCICDISEWEEKEKYFISEYRKTNDLTNYSDGGEGTSKFDNMDYEDACEIIKNIPEIIKNIKHYREVLATKYGLPTKAPLVFKYRGWVTWSHYFGKQIREDYKTYFYTIEELITVCKENNILSIKEYRNYKKIDDKLNDKPERHYKNFSWDLLFPHTKKRIVNINNSNNYLSYNECKEWVKNNLEIKTSIEWKTINKNTLPNFIPGKPEEKYKEFGWISWSEFLDNKVEYLNYEDAKLLMVKLNITTSIIFRNSTKTFPDNMPKTPEKIYTNDWISWGVFLGTNNIANKLMDFISLNDLKLLLKENNITKLKEYNLFYKNNINNENYKLPHNIFEHYKNDSNWVSWEDLVDKKIYYLNYDKCKKFVNSKNIVSISHYNKEHKILFKDKGIPKCPDKFYKEWVSWSDFLGVEIIATQNKIFITLNELLHFFKENNINNSIQWINYKKHNILPKNVPSEIMKVYRKEINNWKHLKELLKTI